MRRLLLLALVLVTACSSQEAEPPAAPAPGPSLPVVTATIGGARLQVEVADTEQTRADGLRGRAGVPEGTGMVFRFPQARPVGFTMSEVTYPLVAVFALQGEVVGVEQMEPCPGTIDDCPLYGPDGPVDTVVEAAPESLPDVAVGDPLVDG